MNLTPDKERFINILKDNKGILLKVIRLYCKNRDDWKDLEQEIIIQLWRSFKNYDDQFKLSTWMYRIALNVAISHYRRDQKRRNETSLEEAIFVLADDGDDQFNEGRTLLYKFIGDLDEMNKALIILHLEEHSHKEIAQILGITDTNVATKINRIKNKFKEFCSSLNY